ncbi:DNA adenine methylase [Ekhidna sp.]|jgi:DNA adenine methylase|uniref:DNA adenine methylase n=1 Tax=Ekhidna sp. TaxID=2608089 RepID=UPI0032F074AB
MSNTETISKHFPEANDRLADERVLGTVGRPLLRYHGGKWKLAQWIISHFPDHRIYCEPFGGAASVLLQKRPSYAEVYNDLDLEVVNLFRVVRESGSELVSALVNTPFAREEFELSYLPTDDDFERARRTVIRSFMGFGSGLQSHQRTGFRSNSNRSGTTPAHDWKNYPEALKAIIERLRGVVIENRDAMEVMNQHDGDKTLHYVDPPYVLDTRYKGQKTKVYRHEMDNEAHLNLCEFLKGLRGYVILSGYDNEIYNDILNGWYKYTRKAHADGAKERIEVLWMNRKENAGQIGLFQ